MGLLRIYLALCVVAGHAGMGILPWTMHTSWEAVQIFFMISGFYMSLIATKYASTREFYASRALRIFVPYYVILALVILLSVGAGLSTGNWLALNGYVNYSAAQNGLAGVAFTGISNVTVFFQDWVNFLQHDAGTSFSFTAHSMAAKSPLYNFLVIPPSWSISIELTFYLLVPLLTKLRTHWLVVIAVASLGLRLYAYNQLGLAIDAFTYRFFPFELLLFVAGMISQRVYARTLAQHDSFQIKSIFAYLVFIVFMMLVFRYSERAAILLRHPLGKTIAPLVSYAFWAAVIPLLFHLTKNIKADRFIGELSYPVYLIHFVIVQWIDFVLFRLSVPSAYLGMVSAVVSLALAGLLYLKIFAPFERKRESLAKSFAARRNVTQDNSLAR